MGISNYERQYMNALINIYENGFSDGVNERTKKETKRLPGIIIRIDVEKDGLPILQSKFVAAKTALREILWIWQAQSNNIHDLNAKIWDSWADDNGAIGLSYGMQMNRPVCIYTDPIHKTPESFRCYKNQAEYVLEYLREFSNGRWAVTTIWNPSELYGMNLVPCCHTTTWNLDGGRLNLVLDQHSGDFPYGVPFNTTQYAELMILFARDLGVEPGLLTHVISDAHIYDNQMEGVEQQIAQYRVLEAQEELKEGANSYDFNVRKNNLYVRAKNVNDIIIKRTGEDVGTDYLMAKANASYENSVVMKIADEAPTDFFKIREEDVEIKDYFNMGKIDFGDVAV